MADVAHGALDTCRATPELMVSAADLLAGRVPPDEAIGLLAGLLDGASEPPVQSDPDPASCLLWHAPLVVVQLWPNRWVARSAALSHILGYPLGICHDHGPLTFIHPADRAAALRAYVETMIGRRAKGTILLRMRAADGGLRLLEATFVGASQAADQRSVVVYAQDRTGWHADRVRLNELAPRFDHGVIVVDETGYVRLTNGALSRVLGPRAGEWAGRREEEVLRAVGAVCSETSSAHQQLATVARAPSRRALRLQLTDGRTVHIERTPVGEGDLALGALWQFWDVSARPSSHESDRSFGEQQQQVLETVSRRLGAIAGFADVLLDGRRKWRRRKEWRTKTRTIARDTRRLLAVVDDLLLLSRMDSGRFSLRHGEVRIPELVRAAVAKRTVEAEARGVVLAGRTGRGPTLSGDEDRLRRVLDNLVTNGMRFSVKGGRVLVSARYEQQRWTIVTTHCGKDVPATDVGLTICRRLVELHRGTLTVERTADTSITMCVTIPVPSRKL